MMLQSAVLAVLICLSVLTNFAAAGGGGIGRDPLIANGTADIKCLTDVDANIMHVSMVIYKNASTVTNAFFVDMNENYFVRRYDVPGCEWSGTGEDDDPFSVDLQIDLSTKLSVEGTTYCGHIANDDTFVWYAFAQESTGLDVSVDAMNVRFSCRAGDLLTKVSKDINIRLPDTIYPQTQYGEPKFGVYLPGSNNLLQTAQLQIGDLFHLGLEFIPDNPDEIEFSPWGAYCKVMYAAPNPDNEYRRFDLLDSSGCPHSDDFLGPFTNMIGEKPLINNVFSSRTGLMNLDRFDRSIDYPSDAYDTIYFTCEVNLCIHPDDQMCIDRCLASSSRRKRSETTRFHLLANITIRDREIAKPGEAQNYMVPILASTGGFLLLLLIILVVAFFCCRASWRYRQDFDSSSDGTDSRPYISSRKSSNMSRGLSNYVDKY